jgi:hypothetical protein
MVDLPVRSVRTLTGQATRDSRNPPSQSSQLLSQSPSWLILIPFIPLPFHSVGFALKEGGLLSVIQIPPYPGPVCGYLRHHIISTRPAPTAIVLSPHFVASSSLELASIL